MGLDEILEVTVKDSREDVAAEMYADAMRNWLVGFIR